MSPKRTFEDTRWVTLACDPAESLPSSRKSIGYFAAGLLLLLSMAVSGIASACSISISNLSQVVVNAAIDNTYRLEGQLNITNPPGAGTLAVRVEGGPSQIFDAPFNNNPQAFVVQGLYADGANRDVTAVFSDDATCNDTESFNAPTGQGLMLELGFSIPQLGWNGPNARENVTIFGPDPNNGYQIGGGPVQAGTFDLDIPARSMVGHVAFCTELSQSISANTNYTTYDIAALETAPFTAGGSGPVGQNGTLIPANGIGPVKAGMVRYLFDNHYLGTVVGDFTDPNGAAFQLAIWDVTHDHYDDNVSQDIVNAVVGTFYETSNPNSARTLAQNMLDDINNLNWSDAQWESYVSVNWHPVYLRSSVNQDLLLGVEVQSTPPTAVAMGEIALGGVEVNEFLEYIGAGGGDPDALLELLSTWNPAVAAGLEGADADTLWQALRDYLDPDGDGRVAILRWETLEERGTIGFYVDRRQPGADWKRINATMLPGLITAPMGGEYWLADPGALPGIDYEYRLIEQEARGTTREYGPFRLRLAD